MWSYHLDHLSNRPPDRVPTSNRRRPDQTKQKVDHYAKDYFIKVNKIVFDAVFFARNFEQHLAKIVFSIIFHILFMIKNLEIILKNNDAVFYRWVSTLRKYGSKIIFRSTNLVLIL